MVDLTSALVTTFTGIIGVGVGAILSNYVNQKVARQAAKKDTIFKKKLEYFEKIVESMGKNIKLYKNAINQLESEGEKANISSIINTLKKNRQKFEMTAGPLYMDTRIITAEIKKFVGREKIIFKCFERLQSKENSRSELIRNIKINFKQIKSIGNNLILLLRKELTNE